MTRKNIEGSGSRVVRRARKSTLDRKIRRETEALEQNLNKVENRLFTQNRVVIATKVYIPEEVRRGVITFELAEVERRVCGKTSGPTTEGGGLASSSSTKMNPGPTTETNQGDRTKQDGEKMKVRSQYAIGLLKLSDIARQLQYRFALVSN